jgi:hypothetical protein
MQWPPTGRNAKWDRGFRELGARRMVIRILADQNQVKRGMSELQTRMTVGQ